MTVLRALVSAALLTGLASAWCLDDEAKGPCHFNVRSKAPDEKERQLRFLGAKDELLGAIEAVKANGKLVSRVYAGKEPSLSLIEDGRAGLGTKDPKHALHVMAKEGDAIAELEAKEKSGLWLTTKAKTWKLEGDDNAVSFSLGEKRLLEIDAGAPANTASINKMGEVVLSRHSNEAESRGRPAVVFRRSRNDDASPHVVTKDDVVGAVEFEAWDGEKYSSLASISASVEGAPKDGRVGSALLFRTANNEGQNAGKAMNWMQLSGDGTLALKSLEEAALAVNGGAIIGKNVNVDGVVVVASDADESISTKGGARVGKSLVVGSSVEIVAGDLRVETGGAIFSGDGGIEIKGKGSIHLSRGGIQSFGKIVCESSVTAETITATEDVIVKGSATVAADFRVDGSLDVGGKRIGAGGKGDAESALQIDASVHVAGDIAAKDFRADGKVAMAKGAVTGELDVGGRASVAGGMSVEDALDVKGTASVTGDTAVGGSFRAGETLFVSDRTVAIGVNADAKTNDEEAPALRVSGHAEFASSLNVQGDVTAEGSLSISKISGFQATGDIDIAHHTISNVSIVGGKLEAITRLDVRADIFTSGSHHESSDERFKKNIKPMNAEEALKTTLGLRGVTFMYDTEKHPDMEFPVNQTRMGFIAQEVETLVPEIVTEDPSTGMKYVSYSRAIPLLVESLKAIAAERVAAEAAIRAAVDESDAKWAARVEGLEARLAALEGKLSSAS